MTNGTSSVQARNGLSQHLEKQGKLERKMKLHECIWRLPNLVFEKFMENSATKMVA
jgi:hypothetical protein